MVKLVNSLFSVCFATGYIHSGEMKIFMCVGPPTVRNHVGAHGVRAFPVAAAKVWDGLPSDVTSASSLSMFKNRLKTYLFRRCYETA